MPTFKLPNPVKQSVSAEKLRYLPIYKLSKNIQQVPLKWSQTILHEKRLQIGTSTLKTSTVKEKLAFNIFHKLMCFFASKVAETTNLLSNLAFNTVDLR